MPEGPEVRKNTDYLRDFFLDTQITRVEIISGRYKRHGPFHGYESLVASLPASVSDVSCKGKFMYIVLEDKSSIWITLGMSGMWQNYRTKHTRVILENSIGSRVYFNDTRNFGTLKYVSCVAELGKKLESLGPDVLNDKITPSIFFDRIKKAKNKTIAEALMNQKIISGIGNYLKSEILYASKISPHRTCDKITSEESKVLCKASRSISNLSYKSGGATLSTYTDAYGNKGMYSRRFAVYNQKSDPEGNSVLREPTRDGRTTFWVPKIQT